MPLLFSSPFLVFSVMSPLSFPLLVASTIHALPSNTSPTLACLSLLVLYLFVLPWFLVEAPTLGFPCSALSLWPCAQISTLR
jgi:hypothetical protein